MGNQQRRIAARWRKWKNQKLTAKHAHDYMHMLRIMRSIDDTVVIKASKSAFSGRLTITKSDTGYASGYCTGQYWPTEYRNAACAVLAQSIVMHWRELQPELKWADIKRKAKQFFGIGIQKRWFS